MRAAEEQQEEPQGDSRRLSGLTLESEYDTAPQTTTRWCCWDIFDESYWKYENNLKRLHSIRAAADRAGTTVFEAMSSAT